MVQRVAGGIITDQMLTGSLRYFELAATGIGADAIGDGNQRGNYAVVADGGSGYSVSDVLTVAGGTGTAPTFTVRTVDTAGAVTSVALTVDGDLSAVPANPAATTGGGGSGATLNVDYTSNIIVPGAADTTGTNVELYVGVDAPVPLSAADQALAVVATRATIVQIALVDDDTIHIACENTGFGWETVDGSGSLDTDLELSIQALGTVDVPDDTNTGTTTDLSSTAVSELDFSNGIA